MEQMVKKAKDWIEESYQYGLDEKAKRRCLENAMNHLMYVINLMRFEEGLPEIKEIIN